MNTHTDDRHSDEIVELSTGGFEIRWKRKAAQYWCGVFSSRMCAQRVLEQMTKQSAKTGGDSPGCRQDRIRAPKKTH